MPTVERDSSTERGERDRLVSRDGGAPRPSVPHRSALGFWRPSALALIGFALALPLLFLAGCTLTEFPQSTLHPQSNFAQWIQDLLEILVFWVVVIFVVVMGLLLYIVVRFRSRPGMPDPKPVHGHTLLEIGWTIAPAIILALVAVPTVLTIYRTEGEPPPDALHVKVVGHQWWWEFQYPQLGVVTASEMHVPVGRPISVDIASADVLHSFWFPAIGGKRDAVPTRINRIWFTPDSLGTFKGQCAELCGVSHANMRALLKVVRPEEFDAWVAHQKTGPVQPDSASLAGEGKRIFTSSLCVACHTIQGVSPGVLGPNLTHVGSRATLAGAIFENNAENMGHWLEDPPARKPGSLMPKLGLRPDQVSALVAYLQSLK